MKFGENLYSLRKNAKMSQEKLAEAVGVSRQSVSKWENGESYPEMENMLKLCEIFHCKLNDLVHEDMQDIDSLDEEIKMSVVKLEKGKQKKLKVLSKIIYIIAKIGKIAARIASWCIIVGAILGVIVLANTNIKSNKNIEFGWGTDIAEYVENEDGSILVKGYNESKELVETEIDEESREDFKKVVSTITRNSKEKTITYIIVISAFAVASLILLSISLGNLEKLFKNINEGDTPFTMENVNHIKKMTYFMIAVTIVSAITSAIAGIFTGTDVNFNIGMGLVNILFLYSIAYIFEYGYNLQQDSQGKIYGEDTTSNE